MLAVELMLPSEQVANIEEGESSEKLTVPVGAAEPDPDWRSLTVTVHESPVPTTMDDKVQLMRVAVV